MSSETEFPNIARLLRRYLQQLAQFDNSIYIVLRDELRDATEYKANLELLEEHLVIAEAKCNSFAQLIGELKNLGTLVDEVNRRVLDKLAEIRAIVGLDECGFSQIAFAKSPDLLACKDQTPYAVEVTRISAPGGVREPPEDIVVTVVQQGDEDTLKLQLISKVLSKRDQLTKTGHPNHLVWISTGRDYFTAGRYEPDLAGLRRGMPRHLQGVVEEAASDQRIRDEYPQLVYLAASPGRDGKPFLCEVKHAPTL